MFDKAMLQCVVFVHFDNIACSVVFSLGAVCRVLALVCALMLFSEHIWV